MQIWHLPPLFRFIPQFAQIFIIFALIKFEANTFFRPNYRRVQKPLATCFQVFHSITIL